MPRKIVLAGEGGQGVQTVAKIIAQAAQKSGKISVYLPSFGVEQRGGVSLAFLQISQSPISYPKFDQAEIIVCFSNRSIKAVKDFIKENTLFIYDNSAIETPYLEKIQNQITNYLAVPALKIAREKYSIKSANMIILGAILAHLKEIDFGSVEKEIIIDLKDKIAKKPEIKDLNLNALKEGLNWAENFDKEKVKFEGLVPPQIERKYSKEGISWERFPEYCKGCGLCLLECPVQALKFSEDSGFLGTPLPIVEMGKCIGCQKCQYICPDGAIKVEKN